MNWKKWWPVVFLTGLLVIILAAGLTNEIVNYCINSGVNFAPQPEQGEYYLVEGANEKRYLIVTGASESEFSYGQMVEIENNPALLSLAKRTMRESPNTVPIKIATQQSLQ